MARLISSGTLIVYSAAAPEEGLRITLTPERGDRVRVLVDDRGFDDSDRQGSANLFARPYRADALVEVQRVEQLIANLLAVLQANHVPAPLTDTDLVLQVDLPLDDGPVELQLSETEGAPPLPLALGMLQDFALAIATRPEAYVEDREGPVQGAAHRVPWARALIVVVLVGIGGYLIGDFFERALGCGP
jgi:hypothetical protein